MMVGVHASVYDGVMVVAFVDRLSLAAAVAAALEEDQMLFAVAMLVVLLHDAGVLVQCELYDLLSALPMEVLNKLFELA
jgi:hypothetical protein